jgi:hypothetical protein
MCNVFDNLGDQYGFERTRKAQFKRVAGLRKIESRISVALKVANLATYQFF